MDKTIKINFEASAKGLEKIFQDLTKISNGLDLTEKTKKSMAELQVSLPAFMARIQAAMSNESFSLIDLKELDKEFKGLSKMLEGVIAGIRSSNLSSELANEIAKAEARLKQKQEAYATDRATVRGKQNKLNSKRDSGLAKTEENRVFSEVTKGQGIEINDTVVQSYEDFIAVLQKARNEGKLTEEQSKALAQTEQQLATAMEKRRAKLQEEIDTERATWQSKREGIAAEKASIAELNAKVAESTELTAQEKEMVNQLISAQIALGDARTQQANAVDKATKEEKELRDERERSTSSTHANTSAANQNAKAHDKNRNSVSKAAKQVFTYGTIMQLFRRAYQLAINTVKDMDKALTDMAVVTSMSRQDAYELTGQFRELATQTGKTTTEIANMATKFYQQGKSTSQVMQLTEAAARAATIAGIDGSRSIDLLTNAMNGFQLGAEKAMEVSDKFAALAASAATDYEELAVALSKVAAQANLAGMSMDFTLGMLTKGIEVTREAPETIGTALKTVIARMRELTDYGATLEDGIDVNRVDTALQNVGVSLMDVNGEFRDLDDVLTDLGRKWDTLNKNQQANVAVALAGTRQQSRLIAMMQDFDRTLELVDISANSYGATMAQSADYMEGLEAATTRMKTAYEGLISALTNSDLIIGIVDLIGTIGNVITGIVQQAWLFIPILVLVGGYLFSQLQTKMALATINREELIEKNKILLAEKEQEIATLKATLAKAKELRLVKTYAVQEKKSALNAKKRQKIDQQRLIIQLKLNGRTAEAAREEMKLKLIDGEILSMQSELSKLQAEEVAAKQVELKAQKDLTLATNEKHQLELANANLQMQNMGFLGTIANSLTGVISLLMIIPSILMTIASLSALITKWKEKGVAAEIKAKAAAMKTAMAEKIKAAWSMAGSAGSIPYVGWIIAGAIIAALIGAAIATAVAASKDNDEDANESIAKTREELNKLQADMYNLEQSRQSVNKLAAEFENLSDKIIKTDEDLQRMGEIAQQINDEAGRTIVDTAADYETQLNQIRGYEIQLEREQENKRQEINETLGDGLKDAQSGWTPGMRKKQKEAYMEAVKTDPAFINSIRTVAMGEISGMADASQAARDAVLDLLVDNIDKEGLFGEDGVNIDAFEEMVGQSYKGGFDSFMTELDEAMTSGKLTDYANVFDNIADGMEGMFAESIPMLKAIQQMGSETARQFDAIGFSADELNSIWSQIEANTKALGGTSDDAAAKFAQLAQELSSTDGNQRQAAYAALVEDTLAASEASKEVLAMSDDELAAAAASGNETAAAYQQAKAEETAAQLELEAKEKALEKAQEKGDENAIAEAQAAYDEAATKLAEAEGNVKAFSDAADNANVSILDMQKLLGTKSTSEIVEGLTKASSTMERLGKVTDLTNLSIKEQMELLSDYPSLLGAMERGFLTVADAEKIMKETMDDAKKDTEQVQSDLSLIYRSGTGTIKSSDQWGKYSAMFTEGGADLRAELIDADLDENSEFVQMLKTLNPELTDYEALEAARQVQDSAKQYNEAGYLLHKYETEGYTAIMSEADKEAWKSANSVAEANRSLVESLTEDLNKLEVGSDKYNEVFARRNNALNDAVEHGKQRLDEINTITAEMLTDSNGESLADYVSFINGVAYLNAETVDELTDAQKESLSVVISQLNAYAEEYKEVNDQIVADNEARAQALIDAEAKVLEAQIQSLETRKEAYEKYFDEVAALEEEQDRTASMEDITKQLAALAGGSGAATNEQRKELMSQLEDLRQEEEDARKEAAREALITSIDEQVEALNTQLDTVNDSLNAILQAITNGDFKIETNETTGEVKLLKKDGDEWIEHKFANGGLVDYTGPAWVDGTPSDPEAFLSAADTKNMRALLDAIQMTLDSKTAIIRNTGTFDSATENIHIENINIQTNELNNSQDFRTSGQAFADEFAKAIRQRGMNINVKR